MRSLLSQNLIILTAALAASLAGSLLSPCLSMAGGSGVNLNCVWEKTQESVGGTIITFDPFPRGYRGDREAARAQMIRLIERINTNLGASLKPVPRLRISFVESSLDERASCDGIHITLGWPPRSQARLEALLSHEYGHALFESNMASFSRSWDNWVRGWGLHTGDESRHVAESKRPKGSRIAVHYEELFADTLAVMQADDPKAMADSGRDFTVEVTPREYGKKENLFETGKTLDWIKYGPRNDVHNSLNPVRSFLWKNYLSRPEYKAKYGEILAVLHQVCADDLLAQASETPERSPKWLKSFNKRMIKKLKKALSLSPTLTEP